MTSGIFPNNDTDHVPVYFAFPVVSTNRGKYFIKSFGDNSRECLYRIERSLIKYDDAFKVGNNIK